MKRLVCLFITVIMCIGLVACEDNSTTIHPSDYKPQYFGIGDVIPFSQENGGEFTLTLTESDDYCGYQTIYKYVDYEIINTGNYDIEFWESNFSCYMDGYSISIGYPMSSDDLGASYITLPPNRKAKGRVYFTTNTYQYENIEIELYDAKWLIE